MHGLSTEAQLHLRQATAAEACQRSIMARTDARRASTCCQGAFLLLAASCTVIVAEAGEKGRQFAVGMVILRNNTVLFGGDVTRGVPGTAKCGAIP
jgi:hypothetical protein